MKDSATIGEYGDKYIYLGLKRVYANIKKVPGNIEQQLEYGDYVCMGNSSIEIPMKKVEVKTELKDPNENFFFERWSNRTTKRDGWLITSKADELFYIFWDAGYGFRFSDWQRSAWIISYLAKEKNFQLVKQEKYVQENDTWGYLFPQKLLLDEGGPFAPFKFQLINERKDEVIKMIAGS